MKAADIRRAFLEYFRSKDHSVVPSSALVPENDPTLLFTNAGMNQFKDCFLGAETRSYKRAATCQKCLRISGKHNDFENVGVTARHHTFFEMLGNFSFGDYFKEDAIKFGWEFVTEVLGISASRLWVTVYEKDEEAATLWKKLTKIKPERILRMGEADNFWSMGDTGPCGPCSEIYVFVGKDEQQQTEEAFRRDDGTFLEIWNLVFMQFNRDQSGHLAPLPKPAVDTGMGLERTASVIQKVNSNYDTDLLRGIIAASERLSGFKYDGSSYEARDLKHDRAYARDVAMRVIADHSRAISFLIGDGVMPGNEGRGYVLRRLLRRAVRHGRVLEFKEPFLAHTCDTVVSLMADVYPELREKSSLIFKVVMNEEEKFYETLDAGLQILNKEVEKLPTGEKFPGQTAFLLHDTYGFPLDLTEDALKTFGRKVDLASFEAAMNRQKSRSREERKSQDISFKSVKITGPKSEFLGYDRLEADSEVIAVISEQSNSRKHFKSGDTLALVLKATPFYAESGGQVGDSGSIVIDGAKLHVYDTHKIQDGYFVHNCEVQEGECSTQLSGVSAKLFVDSVRREQIRTHHSATHLLHAALRQILGSHVKQAGSRVDEQSLRFDYSHFEPVSESQLEEIQSYVNQEIRLNHEVSTRVMSISEAKNQGAMALFGEKYGDIVRVVEIGPKSLELCGGTHVNRSGDLGFLLIASETGISAGIRRIECWAGLAAHQELLKERNERQQIAQLLKTGTQDLPDKIDKIQRHARALERELESLKARIASAESGDLAKNARVTQGGIRVIAEKVDSADSETLRNMVDNLRSKLGSGIVALGSSVEGKALIVAGATADVASTIHVGDLLKEATKGSGGRGGGRRDFGQAGGVDPAKLSAALNKLFELIG